MHNECKAMETIPVVIASVVQRLQKKTRRNFMYETVKLKGRTLELL